MSNPDEAVALDEFPEDTTTVESSEEVASIADYETSIVEAC